MRAWLPRPFWVRLHRWAGLATAGFLFLAGLTGAVIAFGEEIDLVLNPGLMRVPVRDAPWLGPDALASAIEAADPRLRVTRVFLQREPGRSVRVSVVPRQRGAAPLDFSDVHADPHDGRILGTRQWRAYRLDRANLVPFLFRLHYALHIPGSWGVWLMGGVALVWLLDCGIGLYLTLPPALPRRATAGRKRFWPRWAPAWTIRWRAGAYRLQFDLHRAASLWLWFVLLVLALSSVYLNLRKEVFVPAVTLLAQLTPPPASRLPLSAAATTAPPIGLDRAVQLAQAALPPAAHDFTPRFVTHLHAQGSYRVGFQQPGWRQGLLRIREEQVYLEAHSGRVLLRSSYDEGTAADKFLAWQYPLHSGEILGLPGRILVSATGLVVALLCVTGVVIWARKRSARRRGPNGRQRTPPAGGTRAQDGRHR